MSREPVYEVAIVGGGPIGIELAVALKRAGVGHVHFEAGQVGHTILWWPPGTRWFSSNERIAIAGVPLVTPDQGKATREQYLAYLRQVVTLHDLDVRTFEPVTDVRRRRDELFEVESTRHGERRVTLARHVVLCVGGTDRPRRLGVPGEELPHVSGYFGEPHLYFRRRVLVVGGRNSAVEAALRCHHAGARRVTLSYRGAELPSAHIKYWLMPEIGGLIRAGKIDAHFGTLPTRITPTHVTLRRCGAEPRDDGDPIGCDAAPLDVEADAVLALIGYEQDAALLVRCGVELSGPQQVPTHDPATMQTNVERLFVAGTAVAGSQRSNYRVFLENCHVHVDRIVAAITGRAPTSTDEPRIEMPES